MNPLVSVIITTKDEEKNIINCIKSIKKQSYKNTEIIVIDQDSTDGSKEILKSIKGIKTFFNKSFYFFFLQM